MVEVSFTLTEKEYLAFNLYTCWLRPEKRLYRLRYYILGPIAAFSLCFLLLYFFDGGKLTAFSLVISLSGAVILALLLPSRLKTAMNAKTKKLLGESGMTSLISPTKLKADEEGISGINQVSEVKYNWNSFKSAILMNDCYYLYITVIHGVVIPLSAFSSKEEIGKFEELVTKNITNHSIGVLK